MGLEEEDSLIQENIQEFIHDENKIVTCKWLSLTLSVSVNAAKQALTEFVTNARKSGNNDDINVTYFLAGFHTQDVGTKILKCIVVPESHLDSMKQSLDPITCCHVYSVQRSQLKDYTPLYQADYDVCLKNVQALNTFSSISCPWIKSRDCQSHNKEDNLSNKGQPKAKDTDTPKTACAAPAPNHAAASKTTKEKKGSDKKGGIASMFAAAEKKQKEKKTDKPVAVNSDSKTAASKAKVKDEKKGIQAFMKGQTTAKESTKEKDVSPKSKEMLNTSQGNQKTSNTKKPESEKARKHKVSDVDGPQKRKRRRIRDDLFDSSDDENNDRIDDDDEDSDVNIEEKEDQNVIDASIEEFDEEDDVVREGDKRKNIEKGDKSVANTSSETKQETSHVGKDGRKRKRTRKLVPKQHIDEDGFMVTEKVWESDSTDASDEEQEVKPAPKATSPAKAISLAKASKPAAQSKKKTTTSPSKNKQTSLMSFFKKK